MMTYYKNNKDKKCCFKNNRKKVKDYKVKKIIKIKMNNS